MSKSREYGQKAILPLLLAILGLALGLISLLGATYNPADYANPPAISPDGVWLVQHLGVIGLVTSAIMMTWGVIRHHHFITLRDVATWQKTPD